MQKVSSENLLILARGAILQEAQTLSALSAALDQAFVDAVNCILRSGGRIIVTGIGKSALIGKKIVATFNSTNNPSIFMHAADALHGDLGVLQSQDVVICLSKSGETLEIKALVPLIKTKGNILIAVVAQSESYLAKQADIVIITPIEKESDPDNLVPTASTMAQLAVGDALAISLMHMKGFKTSDFAVLHPGGMLGKQLHWKAKDLSSLHASPQVFEDSSIRDVIVEISSKRLGATAVLNHQSRICGIITDGDLRRMLERVTDYTQLSALDIMTRNPKMIDSELKATEALERIRRYNITQLLVVEGDRYLGILHIHDLLREGF